MCSSSSSLVSGSCSSRFFWFFIALSPSTRRVTEGFVEEVFAVATFRPIRLVGCGSPEVEASLVLCLLVRAAGSLEVVLPVLGLASCSSSLISLALRLGGTEAGEASESTSGNVVDGSSFSSDLVSSFNAVRDLCRVIRRVDSCTDWSAELCVTEITDEAEAFLFKPLEG